jgi:TetR/AcrR family transcriptional repressor for divergent bdcA
LKKKIRLRKPAFDRENGIIIAETLFHERGYDAVSVAELTKALGINPPSLYAAYGSKAELFQKVLTYYVTQKYLPMDKILSNEHDPIGALTDLFVAAAKHYTKDEKCRGCLVTESLKATDQSVREMAEALTKEPLESLTQYIDKHFPNSSKKVGDYVFHILQGLSSHSRLGSSQKKLVECARTAAKAIELD